MNITSIKFLDKYCGAKAILLLSLFKRKKQIKQPKNILLIQLWGIGETITALPAIESLYKHHKNIDILTTERTQPVFKAFHNYKNLKIINLSFTSILKFITKNYNKYDLVIDMEEYLNISALLSFFTGKQSIGYNHNIRSLLYDKKIRYNDKQHVSKTFMDLMTPLNAQTNFNQLTKLETTKEDKKRVENLLKSLNLNKFIIGIAPNVAESSKCRIWPIERFAKLADFLIEKKNASILFIGGPNDKKICQKTQQLMKNKSNNINLAGRLSLNQTFYLIEKLNLLIGNDSGPMHIGASQRTKTIGLFGPNLPIRFGPYGNNNKAIYKNNCEFSPCINVHKGQVPDCLYKKNSKNYQKCMKNISVEDVIKEI